MNPTLQSEHKDIELSEFLDSNLSHWIDAANHKFQSSNTTMHGDTFLRCSFCLGSSLVCMISAMNICIHTPLGFGLLNTNMLLREKY